MIREVKTTKIGRVKMSDPYVEQANVIAPIATIRIN